MDIEIIQVVLNVFDHYGEGIRFDIERFEQVLNDEAPHLIDECYLVVLGMKHSVFDAMIFDEDRDYYGYVEYLKETLSLKESEALFMVCVFDLLLKEVGYYFEVDNMSILLQEAYNQNNFDQLFIIAKTYYDGFGVGQDYEKAFGIFNYLYSHGDDRSSYYIAYMYEHGYGVEKDIEKALLYYENKDDDLCHLRLGKFYMLGQYHLYDLQKAYEHLSQSQLPEAYFYLGLLLEKRHEYSEAFMAFYKGSTDYQCECLYKVGLYLKYGIGIDMDLHKAYDYFEKAYYMLHGDSAYELSMIYFDGIIVKKNIKKALRYLKQAARLYSEEACIMLGHFYQIGEYVEKDLKKSGEYYGLARAINEYTKKMIESDNEDSL